MSSFTSLEALIFGAAVVFLLAGLMLGTRGLLGDMGRICFVIGGALALAGFLLALAQYTPR